MAQPFQNVSARTLRISYVWLVGAVWSILLLIVDWLAPDLDVPPAIVGAVTSLILGLALFYDTRRAQGGDTEIFDPGENHVDG